MSIYISQRPAGPLSQLEQERPYDLVLASVGYEERSRAIPAALAPPQIGIGLDFADRNQDAYEENRREILARGYEVFLPEERESNLLVQVKQWFERAAAAHSPTTRSPLRMAVDISSMTRARIAAIIEACYSPEFQDPAIVDLLYAPATYRPSPPQIASWVQANPVTPHFAGWDPDPAKPLLTVIGLGYEPNAAEHVIEWVTPDETCTMIPVGREPDYQRDVEKVNAAVIEKAAVRHQYSVEDPYRLILDLERMVLSRLTDRRVLFVPLGPKIFAASCMLVAQRLHPHVSVWRFSAGPNEAAKKATAANWLCGIRLSTRPEATPGFDQFPGGGTPKRND